MMLLATSISVYATSCLYNSSDVSYTAPTGSGLSANVQDSLTEVYGHCTDYTSMDTRVSSLEGHFLNNATSYFDGDNLFIAGNSSTTPNGSWIEFMNNGIDSLGIGVHSSGNTEIATKDSDGTIGGAPLTISASTINLKNNSNTSVVKVNNSNVVTESMLEPTAFSITPASRITYTNNSCYKIGRIRICSLWITDLDSTKFPQNAETTLGSIPSGHIPNYTVWGVPGFTGTNNQNIYFKIINGNLIASHKGGDVSMLMINVTYVV